MPNTEFKNFSLAKIIGDELNQQFDLDNYQQMDEWELSAKGLLSEQDILDLYLKHSALELTDDESFDEPMVFEGINPNYLKEWICLPLRFDDNSIDIAIATPYDIDAIKMHWKHMFKLDVHLSLARRSIIERSIEDLYFNIDISDNLSAFSAESLKDIAQEAPIVRLVNDLFSRAIEMNASDIHIEPSEDKLDVRFRIDGILEEIASPPITLGPRISARLKVMSRLDISERRVPQDGRIKMQLSKKRAIDFRVNTCPTLFGEKIVLRILDPSSAMLGIDVLGYEEDQKQLYLDALAKPYGMILVTGPTGSGKTVSLYTGLNILNTPDRNISTAEDPAEINMPGINQVNVNPKVGLTFASALRAFLRQDPDVIMVGEIRDLETAEIAIKAAQTGHLVLSTLHTNDAPQTLTRLANMGVPPFNIASAVSLIIAQRLARKLCEHCKTVDDIPEEALLEEGFKKAEIKNLTIYKAVGCDQCSSGYKGRVGIYQVMPVSEAMGRIIMEGGNSLQLGDQAAKEGIADLRLSGLQKVRDGIISLEEVNRVTKD